MAKRKSEKTEEQVVQAQFPALEGEPEVEVAKRGADNHEDSSTTHHKVYVLPADQYNPDEPGTLHEDNKRAMRQEMMNLGLRPTGDVSFDGATDHEEDNGRSVDLAYSVGAEPAVTAYEYDEAHAFVNEDEQDLLEAGVPSPRDVTTGRADAEQQGKSLEE